MRKDTWVAAAYEAGLLGLVALLGFFAHAPLIFASLGPTAFEMVEFPERPSARPYNVLVGHGVAIVSGLLALGITHAWSAPPLSTAGVPALRVLSVVLAGLITVVGTLLLKATQPAALSTALLVSLGLMQSPKALLSLVIGVLLFGLLSVPVGRHRRRTKP